MHRDTQKLIDFQTLNNAVGIFNARKPGSSIGVANTVYVSLSDTSSTCANLGLPALPSGWTYNCVTSANLQKVDGTGWIPVNFTSLYEGSAISSLPIDPINTVSSGLYYVYVVSGGSYEFNSYLESKKFNKGGDSDKVSKDGGDDPNMYEVGSSLTVSSLAPVGYWAFDEGSGGTVKDSSKNGNNGTITDAAWQTETNCKVGKCLSFNGTSAWVNIGQVLSTDKTLPFTFSAWFNPAGSGTNRAGIGTNSSLAQISINTATRSCFGQNGGGGWFDCDPTAMTSGNWNFVVGVYDGTNSRLYVNAVLKNGPNARSFTSNHGTTILGRYSSGGGEWMNGKMDEAAIYNRVLSVAEIQNIYNATK